MKVLHVIPSLSPARGGPGIALRQVTAGLSAQGVTVDVAATDDDGPDRHLSVPLGTAVPDSGATCFYFPRQTSFYSYSRPLAVWLQRSVSTYDVVHIHALFNYPCVAAAHIARRHRVPYVLRPLGTLATWGLTSRRPLLKGLSLRFVERPIMKAAAAVQATSEQERSEVLAACPDCRAIVIPNPVEIPSSVPPRIPKPAPSVLLFLSRIDPKKGLELLLRAFDRVAATNPALRLIVAGDGEASYVASIHRLASSLAARSRIDFRGHVNGAARTALFAEADLFVLPSYSENFGVAVVEAMAYALPVVISPHVGIHSEVTASAAGVACPCDVEPLAAAIQNLLAGSAELIRMGENGRDLAVRSFSPEVVAALLKSEYEDIILRNKTFRMADSSNA